MVFILGKKCCHCNGKLIVEVDEGDKQIKCLCCGRQDK